MRNAYLLFILMVLGLAACGGSDPVDREDPFATLHPWDADRKGVVTTETGLEYYEIEAGPEGGLTPELGDMIVVNFEGRVTESGEVFESSYERGQPALFGVGQRFGGWLQTVLQMQEGDEWVVNIPSELAFGDRGFGDVIKPDDDLLFRIDLQKVIKAQTSDADAWDKYTPWDPEGANIIKTESGLQYIILEEGDKTTALPTRQSFVAAFYEGRLAETGERFDSGYERGSAFTTDVTRVISGWTEMLQLMHEGQRVLVYIPSELGYGARGTPGGPIPPNADLIFEMQLMATLTPAGAEEEDAR